jgi:MFS family permease
MKEHDAVLRAGLRTPRAAGVAGIVFSLLLATALALIHLAAPSSAADSTWLTDPGQRRMVNLALNLVPFAGIAFLWFIGVIRDRVGEREDRFFASVFLGSGLLFVAMLFVGAAIAGGLATDPVAQGGAISPEVWAMERRIVFTLLNVDAIRMGAVFILSTTLIGVRIKILPTWLAVTGYVAAAMLLVGVFLSPWVNLVMPVWAFVFSVDILLKSKRIQREILAGTAEG